MFVPYPTSSVRGARKSRRSDPSEPIKAARRRGFPMERAVDYNHLLST